MEKYSEDKIASDIYETLDSVDSGVQKYYYTKN